jgi:hypothetical protein
MKIAVHKRRCLVLGQTPCEHVGALIPMHRRSRPVRFERFHGQPRTEGSSRAEGDDIGGRKRHGTNGVDHVGQFVDPAITIDRPDVQSTRTTGLQRGRCAAHRSIGVHGEEFGGLHPSDEHREGTTLGVDVESHFVGIRIRGVVVIRVPAATEDDGPPCRARIVDGQQIDAGGQPASHRANPHDSSAGLSFDPGTDRVVEDGRGDRQSSVETAARSLMSAITFGSDRVVVSPS